MKQKKDVATRRSSGVRFGERSAILEDAQRRKMATSAHRYVRGSTVKFYEWLSGSEGQALPDGPPIWICGDCHIGNLGPVADGKGHIEIEIRDVDQTVIGNPAHDLVRLALSLASAARGNDLPGVTTAHMMEHMMEGYRRALDRPGSSVTKDLRGVELRPVRSALQRAAQRKWKHLAEERIGDVTPTIPLGRVFWALHKEERRAIHELFASEHTQHMVQKLVGDHKPHKVRVVDAAYWMKGCSSLGRLRFAALIQVKHDQQSSHRLIDIKEAVKAAAPAAKQLRSALKDPVDYAQRVVSGARALSPYLGNRMMASRLLHRPVVVRELMPQDLKLEMNTLTREEAVGAARYLATVVGRAHARQMDEPTRQRWSQELERSHTKSLDAPSWLWRSVVTLLATHEMAYLEHCRKYALQK